MILTPSKIDFTIHNEFSVLIGPSGHLRRSSHLLTRDLPARLRVSQIVSLHDRFVQSTVVHSTARSFRRMVALGVEMRWYDWRASLSPP